MLLRQRVTQAHNHRTWKPYKALTLPDEHHQINHQGHRALGTGATALAGSAAGVLHWGNHAALGAEPAGLGPASTEQDASRARRMKWWHEARFGMFIHWGLYSVIGQHEWAMEVEGIPVAQYQLLAKHFTPKPHAAREWAKLAKRAGQKYMVMTTKHHEGFCQFDTKLTNYCAPKQACGRDLVAEFVEAARGEGLRVGFYYSLMDWHHPDGARCLTDEAARGRFVEYTHGLIRELLTNYGKIDVLWYDVDWPLSPQQWESEKMNKMVFELQPDIIVNDRNGLPGDFSTPEQEINPAKAGKAWETCMTMNESWGYHKADTDWKSTETIVRNLSTCAHDTGNFLLNIGPKPDGSGSRGVGTRPHRSGRMDGQERSDDLPNGSLPLRLAHLRQLHPQR